MQNHKIVKELLSRGIPVLPTPSGVRVEGFYRCNSVELSKISDEIVVCTQRYGDVEEINSFDQLVLIHFNWWLKSRERTEIWKNPDSNWVNDYVRLALVEVELVKTYKPIN